MHEDYGSQTCCHCHVSIRIGCIYNTIIQYSDDTCRCFMIPLLLALSCVQIGEGLSDLT